MGVPSREVDVDEEAPPRARTQGEASGESTSTATPVYQFLPTSRRFVQFSSGLQPPPGATVVFIDGAFDMFHAGTLG